MLQSQRGFPLIKRVSNSQLCILLILLVNITELWVKQALFLALRDNISYQNISEFAVIYCLTPPYLFWY